MLSDEHAITRRAAARTIGDPTGALRVRHGTRYRCVVFTLAGDLDTDTAPWLTEKLLAACDEPSGDAIVVDLRHLSLFGAAGLHCFNTVAHAASRHDVRVSLWDPPPFARRILRSADLHPSVLIEPPA